MNMFNPETMKNLMENDEIKNMLNDPNIMGNLKNMMGHSDLFKSMNGAGADSGAGCCEAGSDSCEAGSGSGCCVDGSDSDSASWIEGDINLENLENIDIEESNLNINDKVTTHNLKNELYTGKYDNIKRQTTTRLKHKRIKAYILKRIEEEEERKKKDTTVDLGFVDLS